MGWGDGGWKFFGWLQSFAETILTQQNAIMQLGELGNNMYSVTRSFNTIWFIDGR